MVAYSQDIGMNDYSHGEWLEKKGVEMPLPFTLFKMGHHFTNENCLRKVAETHTTPNVVLQLLNDCYIFVEMHKKQYVNVHDEPGRAADSCR